MADFPPKVRADSTIISRDSTYIMGSDVNIELPDKWTARLQLAFKGVEDKPTILSAPTYEVATRAGVDSDKTIGLSYEVEVT